MVTLDLCLEEEVVEVKMGVMEVVEKGEEIAERREREVTLLRLSSSCDVVWCLRGEEEGKEGGKGKK